MTAMEMVGDGDHVTLISPTGNTTSITGEATRSSADTIVIQTCIGAVFVKDCDVMKVEADKKSGDYSVILSENFMRLWPNFVSDEESEPRAYIMYHLSRSLRDALVDEFLSLLDTNKQRQLLLDTETRFADVLVALNPDSGDIATEEKALLCFREGMKEIMEYYE